MSSVRQFKQRTYFLARLKGLNSFSRFSLKSTSYIHHWTLLKTSAVVFHTHFDTLNRDISLQKKRSPLPPLHHSRTLTSWSISNNKLVNLWEIGFLGSIFTKFSESFSHCLSVYLRPTPPSPPPSIPRSHRYVNFSSKFSYKMINRLTDFTVKKKTL